MLRTTTLLIVMVLAGGPAGSLACELYCLTAAAENHQRAVGCHHASPTLPSGPRVASPVDCHDVAALTPFIAEARKAESARLAPAELAPCDLSAIALGNDEQTAGWCVFNLEPPRPTSSRAVLRI